MTFSGAKHDHQVAGDVNEHSSVWLWQPMFQLLPRKLGVVCNLKAEWLLLLLSSWSAVPLVVAQWPQWHPLPVVYLHEFQVDEGLNRLEKQQLEGLKKRIPWRSHSAPNKVWPLRREEKTPFHTSAGMKDFNWSWNSLKLKFCRRQSLSLDCTTVGSSILCFKN